jgi:sarcosine oxidase, subunit gamma
MSELRFDSPLAGRSAPLNLAISITEIVDRGMIDLRGDLQDPSFATAVESVLGASLPSLPRSCVNVGELSVLWLSVDQWLVQCPRAQATDLAGRLNQALEGTSSLVVDLSDARAIIRLRGDGVREVIMKGAPVDLTAREFKIGAVRRLRFGDVAAMVHMAGESPDTIDLYIFRSYAVFAWDWLMATSADAAQVRLFEPQSAPAA